MPSWRDNLEVWPRKLANVEIDIKSTALLIVDVQLYDTSREHGLAFPMKKFPKMYDYFYNRIDDLVLPNNERLLKYFRDNNLEVVYLVIGAEFTGGRDTVPRRKRRNNAMSEETGVDFSLYKGSKQHEIHPRLEPTDNELVIAKNAASPFNCTGIDQILRNMGINSLIITGVSTCSCVETTARDASDRGYECVLVEDATATFDQESHDSTLKVFARMFGEVWTTEQTINNLQKLLNNI